MPRLNLNESSVLNPAKQRSAPFRTVYDGPTLLEEIGTLITERRSGQYLYGPTHDSDLGPSSIGALEAIEEGNSRLVFELVLIGPNHHSNSLCRIGGITLSR
jgi:hypothetical protein